MVRGMSGQKYSNAVSANEGEECMRNYEGGHIGGNEPQDERKTKVVGTVAGLVSAFAVVGGAVAMGATSAEENPACSTVIDGIPGELCEGSTTTFKEKEGSTTTVPPSSSTSSTQETVPPSSSTSTTESTLPPSTSTTVVVTTQTTEGTATTVFNGGPEAGPPTTSPQQGKPIESN